MSLLRAESGAPTASSRSESTHFDTNLTARVLAGLFAAGATLALLTVAPPHSARASELGLLSIVGTAYLVARQSAPKRPSPRSDQARLPRPYISLNSPARSREVRFL